MIAVFVIGYIAIALEHNIKIDKAATAILIGGITWALLAFLSSQDLIDEWVFDLGKKGTTLIDPDWYDYIKYELSHHLTDIGEILFFLLAAMTIVELVDAHQGFAIITDKITTNNK